MATVSAPLCQAPAHLCGAAGWAPALNLLAEICCLQPAACTTKQSHRTPKAVSATDSPAETPKAVSTADSSRAAAPNCKQLNTSGLSTGT